MKIAQFLEGSSWGELTPTTMNKKGLGGRETALLQLGENWAAAGHEVINFVSVEKALNKANIDYVPSFLARPYLENIPVDVMVSWEEPRIFQVEEIRRNIKLKLVEMQVAHLDVPNAVIPHVDHYAVLSEWAGKFLTKNDPKIDKDKLVVFPNGVDLSRYPEPTYKYPEQGPYKFLYSSSPDRGLHHLLRIWPRIEEMWPGSELHVCYGIEKWVPNVKWTHNMQCETALDVMEGIHDRGIVYHGKIGQDELAKLQVECHALLYPCDTMQPTETGCISIVEAGAACTPVVTTNVDCLETEFEPMALMHRLPFDDAVFLDAINILMNNEELYISLQKRGRQFAEKRDWQDIAGRWLEFFSEELAS